MRKRRRDKNPDNINNNNTQSSIFLQSFGTHNNSLYKQIHLQLSMNLEKKIKTPPTGKKLNGSMFTCINLRERERKQTIHNRNSVPE